MNLILTGASTAGAGGSTILMLVLMFVVFYFFFIRPENKKKKKVEDMRNSLSLGDEITTIGGMTGKIVQVTEDTVTFETGEDRVRIQIKKWGIPPPLRWKQPRPKLAPTRARKSNITRIISPSR